MIQTHLAVDLPRFHEELLVLLRLVPRVISWVKRSGFELSTTPNLRGGNRRLAASA